jgi:putative transposase
VEQVPVNKKRILRLLREHHLLVQPNLRLKAKRTSRMGSKPTKPNEWWGIDMTKVLVEDCGWVYVVVMLERWNMAVSGERILDSAIQLLSTTLQLTANRRLDRWLKHSLIRFGVIIQR